MGYIITQLTGDNPEHYSQYFGPGVGHEGLDRRTPDGLIKSLYDGICVTDNDEEDKGRGYGNFATIWCEEFNLAFQHCHMERNFVAMGDRVKAGQAIGVEGNSQTQAKHEHLNCIVVDADGYRIHEVGNDGRIDPLVHVLRAFGDPDWVDHLTWSDWLKENPQWCRGAYIYGPSTL